MSRIYNIIEQVHRSGEDARQVVSSLNERERSTQKYVPYVWFKVNLRISAFQFRRKIQGMKLNRSGEGKKGNAVLPYTVDAYKWASEFETSVKRRRKGMDQ